LLDGSVQTLQQLTRLMLAASQQVLHQPDVHRQRHQLLLRAVMEVTLEELTFHVLRRNDFAPGCSQQVSPGGDIEQLVVQFGCQAQVAQHQTRLRRKAVQQLLFHRRESLTLAFLDDEYAQQFAAVPDGADVPARYRCRIVGELRWRRRLALTLGVDRGKPDSTTGQQPHLDLAGTHP
jgi:hypothetical protein